MPNITLINDRWSFALNDGEPKAVRIPHDWLIGDAYNHYTSGVGHYTRSLDLSQLKPGQRVNLRFDGVYMDSALFVNGKNVGEWKYGYTTFEFDITDYIKADSANEIYVKVNFDGQSARWYTGAGIYRDVHLIIRNSCHFTPDGIYVSTALEDGKWTWEAEAEVVCDGSEYNVVHTLLDSNDKIEEWDINNPRLYTLRSELLVSGTIEDCVETKIGFRDIGFDSDKGFFLNGRNMKINGVCMHHDLGSLGAAFHKDAARRQLSIMREMGVNAIRTAHNPPATGLMDLCDEMGFLVMSELTDIWMHPKTPGDYARFFDDWVDKDAASWIRRDRNRPSVILWSVGNEIHDTHVDSEGGLKTLQRLLELVKKHDPKVNAPPTLCSNFMSGENTQKCIDLFKIIGYNYNENLYNTHHAAHPEWIIYGGETCSTLQSRGVYHFPLSQTTLSDDDLQCSALGNCTTSWGARNVVSCIRDDLNAVFSIGQFVWSGFDYLGEPTPYNTKNCYFGQTDTAGFKKDSFYIFKSAWTDHKEAPFVHIFPYWDFSPGQLIDIRVCSNAPCVALYFDDKLIGKTDIKDKWIADWQLPYNTGTLRAEAYDNNGSIIASTERCSYGDTVCFDISKISYGTLDFFSITAIDGNGRPVENANNRVLVKVENGELLTLDNGDSSDYESYHSDSKRLFNGKLLAIVRRFGENASSITVENDKNDIPIRKVELSADKCDETGNYIIKAKIFPENATSNDLNWRLTDSTGVESQIGALTVADDNLCVNVTPKGDGVCYVRSSPYNNRKHASFISTYKLEFSGVGKPFINPYEFIFAGLYTDYNIEPEVGIERGIATMRNRDLYERTMFIGYSNINFGSYGTDEVTVWLFPQESEAFDFEIWDGMPEKDGLRICAVNYDKGSIWNQYIEVTYKLPVRLSGIKTICFAFSNKLHFKGFMFNKLNKGLAKHYTAENDGLYGDAFEINGRCVESIGNNVSLTYEDMDFGEAGVDSFVLSSRSALPENTIRIDFVGEKETTTEMIAVSGSDIYSDKVFKLSKRISGLNKVNFVFLPGSNIDFEWFKFS